MSVKCPFAAYWDCSCDKQLPCTTACLCGCAEACLSGVLQCASLLKNCGICGNPAGPGYRCTAQTHLDNPSTRCGGESQGTHTQLGHFIHTHIICDGAHNNCNGLILYRHSHLSHSRCLHNSAQCAAHSAATHYGQSKLWTAVMCKTHNTIECERRF